MPFLTDPFGFFPPRFSAGVGGNNARMVDPEPTQMGFNLGDAVHDLTRSIITIFLFLN